MTGVDWIILAFVTLLALFGYGQGFVVGALSLAGFALGAFLGSRLGPALLAEGSRSPYAPVFALGGAVLVGGVFAFGLETVGRTLRSALVVPGLGVLDGLLGAVLSACVGLGLAWVVGAVALQTPGARELRRDVQRSEILSRLYNDVSPRRAVLNRWPGSTRSRRSRAACRTSRRRDARVARDPDVAGGGRAAS